MDKQTERQKKDREKASEVLDCPEHYLHYFAWAETFANTTGPFGGIGGQAITTCTIEAWSDSIDAAIFCNSKFLKVVKNFEFHTNVRF